MNIVSPRNFTPHIFIVAAEKSGDELGAKLATEILDQNSMLTDKGASSPIRISGIGGASMAAVGLESPIDISPLSILGLVEALKAYPIIMDKVRQCCDLILSSGANVCVLIDSWGFMIRLAKRLRDKGYIGKIVKYVAPQVWAMRPGRAKTLAKWTDHVLTLHSFDAPYFTPYGLEVTYVGNPVFDENFTNGNGQALRDEYDLDRSNQVICILFGSRLSEINFLAGPFADAIEIIKERSPDTVFIAPIANTIYEDVLAAAAQYPALQNVIFLPESRKLDCFDLADFAIACSGTVTTQLACAGVPSIVCYRVNGLTYHIAKHLYRPDYVSIVNIAADQALMPELIQNDCTGAKIAAAALNYLDDDQMMQKASLALLQQTQKMRRGETSSVINEAKDKELLGMTTHARAAQTILEMVRLTE